MQNLDYYKYVDKAKHYRSSLMIDFSTKLSVNDLVYRGI